LENLLEIEEEREKRGHWIWR